MQALMRAAIALSVVLWVPGLLEPFEPAKAEAIRILGWGAVAAALAGGGFRRFRIGALDAAIAGWLAVECLATAASVDRSLSLFGEPYQREGLLTSVGLAGIYIAARAGTPSSSE